MITRRIAGATHNLGAPKGWEPSTDGDCGHLPVRARMRDDDSPIWCESAWEPTPDELRLLNEGGSIILRVIGWQPPVALYVEPALKD